MIINKVNALIFIYLSFGIMAKAQEMQQKAPSIPKTDNYYGIEIVDNYRNLEDLNDFATSNWLEEQTKYSKSILEKIPNREYYINKRLEFDNRKSFSVNQINITENDFYFYLLKKPNDKSAKLFYRKGFGGKEIELFNPENFKIELQCNYLISYIKANYDGSKVAIALTEKGKEISEMIIYDVKQNKLLPYTITHCWPSDSGGISWLPDNNSFIYLHYPVVDPKSDLFLKNMQSVIYTIGEDPQKLKTIFSKSNNPDLKINSEDFPHVSLPIKDSEYLFGEISGAANFKDTYYIPANDIINKIRWKFLFGKDEKISDFIIKKDKIIFLSEKNGVNAIYETSLEKPDFQSPAVLIPSIPDETITELYGIKDGFVFSSSKNGIEAKLYLYEKGKTELLNLPFPAGDLSITTKNELSNDFWIVCSGWKNEAERFKYNYSKKKFLIENLSPIIQYPEFNDIVIKEITVKSHDGLDIPFTLIYKNGIQKNSNNPLLIDAYGAYGTSINPYFAKTYLLWVLNGGIAAVAHVRGGGEKGEQWHEGGFKETKPNSWKDLISCAEFMIKENYTAPDKIAIWGASAGGITVGRAMTERPDLFKAVMIESGILNPLRIESMPNGLNSVKEFGSINNEAGFRGLLEMDAFQHIKKDVNYPATYITSGINDPRVSPWMPSKFAAKLLANNAYKNPILLKIDYEGGHGGSIPLAQRYSNLADIFAFAFWQLGHPDYQIKENSKK